MAGVKNDRRGPVTVALTAGFQPVRPMAVRRHTGMGEYHPNPSIGTDSGDRVAALPADTSMARSLAEPRSANHSLRLAGASPPLGHRPADTSGHPDCLGHRAVDLDFRR